MIETSITPNEILARESDELVGKIVFERNESKLVILHTYAYQSGRGIGSILMEAAIAYAEQEQLTIRPVCSFAAKYLEKKA